MAIRRLIATLVAALIVCGPHLAFAQTAPQTPPAAAPAPITTPAKRLDQREGEVIRNAVQGTYDSYRSRRTANGIGGVVGALLIGGFGGYIYAEGDNLGDPTLQIIGIGIMLSAVPQLIAGGWNIFYETPQEEIAAKLLNDPLLLQSSGLLFIEQEARRAKRERLVGGTTAIAQGAALLGSYYLYAQFFGTSDLLLIFFAIGAALTAVGGVIQLVGLSAPERIYRDTLQELGRGEEGVRPTAFRTNLAPVLLSNDGKLAPGVGLGFSF